MDLKKTGRRAQDRIMELLSKNKKLREENLKLIKNKTHPSGVIRLHYQLKK